MPPIVQRVEGQGDVHLNRGVLFAASVSVPSPPPTQPIGFVEVSDKHFQVLGSAPLAATHVPATTEGGAPSGVRTVRDLVQVVLDFTAIARNIDGGETSRRLAALQGVLDGKDAFMVSLRSTQAATWRFEPLPLPPGDTSSNAVREALPRLTTFDLSGLVSYIEERKVTKILVMCGAGVSVAAGIMDFRSPGGLYSCLEKYNLPTPESVFTLSYMKERPEVFYQVSNEMNLWPGQYPPTHVHHFIKLLDERGLLLRCYTQNIDTLERCAGLGDEKLVEAHGSYATASCTNPRCKAAADVAEVRRIADKREVPRCAKCNSVVKPDVVFFGEGLPKRFFDMLLKDADDAELVLILGTSLLVLPFNTIPSHVGSDVPRVLINMIRAGESLTFQNEAPNASRFGGGTMPNDSSSSSSDGEEQSAAAEERRVRRKLMRHDRQKRENRMFCPEKGSARLFGGRDLFLKGDCQETVRHLAAALGFGEELDKRHRDAFVALKGEKEFAAKFSKTASL